MGKQEHPWEERTWEMSLLDITTYTETIDENLAVAWPQINRRWRDQGRQEHKSVRRENISLSRTSEEVESTYI